MMWPAAGGKTCGCKHHHQDSQFVTANDGQHRRKFTDDDEVLSAEVRGLLAKT
jgi:hypothetical protein